MDNVISAQEVKRRGIGAVDNALKRGPVHVIRRNRPSYVVLTEEDYQRLVGYQRASEQLWDRLLEKTPSGGQSATDIDTQLQAERSAWG